MELVGSPLTSLRHLLGLLSSEILVDVDFIQCSCQLGPPSSETQSIYISIRKIWIKRDLVSLYFKFIYLNFRWLFHNLGCGWEDAASRCCFWLVLCFFLAYSGCVWSGSSCAWRILSHLSSIGLCWRSLITWSKAGKKDDAHWLAPIAVRVTMTMSHICVRPMEYDNLIAARGTFGKH